MKNFLGALLLAPGNFPKAVIVRAAGASGLVQVPWGSFIKISWQYRGFVSRKVRRSEFERCALLQGSADFVVLRNDSEILRLIPTNKCLSSIFCAIRAT